jgi:hypothetical protein
MQKSGFIILLWCCNVEDVSKKLIAMEWEYLIQNHLVRG